MLIIRDEQVRLLADLGIRGFTEEMTRQVRETWPEECLALGEEATRSRVESLVEAAHEHGLSMRYDVSRFVHLGFAFNDPAFHRAKWAADILAEPEVQARIRMNRLWEVGRQRVAGGQGTGRGEGVDGR